MPAGAKAEHPVAIVERATLPEQRTLRGTLETIAELARDAAIKAPALFIVGDVTTFLSPEALPTADALATAVAHPTPDALRTADAHPTADASKDGTMSHGALV